MKEALEGYLASRAMLPGTDQLRHFVRELFPQRYRQVQQVAAEARKLAEKGITVPEQAEMPTRVVPSAPFEELADDIDEAAPTRLWQSDGDGFTMTGIARQRRRRWLLVLVAVLLGSSLGAGLGLGIWSLIRSGTGSPPTTPIVRPITD